MPTQHTNIVSKNKQDYYELPRVEELYDKLGFSLAL